MFMTLLAERRLIVDQHHNEILPVHPECLIIADANPDYRGTMASDEAFQDRFLVKLEFDYDIEVERQFIPSESLLELAQELRRASSVEGKFSVPISTRLLISFVDVALDLGFEPAVYNFINSFPPAEREPLELLFGTYEENIQDDLKNVKVAN
jgi:MoxR-like ATPase